MFSGVSIWQLLIVLLLVVMVFGTKKLRNVGGDLGEAIKGFKKGLKDEDKLDAEIIEEQTEQVTEKVAKKASKKTSSKKS